MIKVFVNGTFDVLHNTHIELLKFAKNQGDYLFVALDDDDRVHEKKGWSRPILNQSIRFNIMESLRMVDRVRLFGSDEELENLIKEYQPDIMIVGSDWRGKPVIGAQYAKQLIYFERVNDDSTTKTLEDFIARRYMCR